MNARTAILAFTCMSAAAATSCGQSGSTSHVIFEASIDGGATWAPSVVTLPGSRVDVRVRAQLLNPGTHLSGFGGMTYQPTLSNWSAASGDVRLPFSSSDGSGVADVPGNTGRVFPYASVGMRPTSASGLLTSFNDPGNILRFAGANQVTPTTNASWGVNSAQLPPPLAGSNYNPSFDTVVFKYAVMLGAAPANRTLAADAPVAYLQNERMFWQHVTDIDGDLYTLLQSDIFPATITVVPAPGGFPMLAVLGLWLHRRRDQR